MAFFSLALCFLFLSHGSVAQLGGSNGQRQPWLRGLEQQRQFRQQRECRLQSLSALRPSYQVESEAGKVELWDGDNEQLRCAGVAVVRYTIKPRGLLLPFMDNAAHLVYILQGRGFFSQVFPGCPESYQSYRQPREGEQEEGPKRQTIDEHQRIVSFKKGDIIPGIQGVVRWYYNDGEEDAIAIGILDANNQANQLSNKPTTFRIAGNQRGDKGSKNLFNAFSDEYTAEAYAVAVETARKLRNVTSNRGSLVHVEDGLGVVKPPRSRQQEQQQQQTTMNGLDETLCSERLKHGIDNRWRADVYNPRAGRATTVNSQKLPILSHLRMSATRVVLYKNAMVVPHWHVNAHSILYVTHGSGRVQVVGEAGRAVFDGQVREGEVLVVPQHYVVLHKAGEDGFDFVAVKTHENAIISQVTGKNSAMSAMPRDVAANAFGLSRAEAKRVKDNSRDDAYIVPPRQSSTGGRVAE
ncbi:hypothetical protein ACLOJK_009623 [Asimina triloba]